jgi:hypothetical protein
MDMCVCVCLFVCVCVCVYARGCGLSMSINTTNQVCKEGGNYNVIISNILGTIISNIIAKMLLTTYRAFRDQLRLLTSKCRVYF